MTEKEKSHQPDSEEKKFFVRKVCSWCKKDFGSAGFESDKPGEETSGVCPECLEKLSKELEGK